jgi:hypothetical protein
MVDGRIGLDVDNVAEPVRSRRPSRGNRAGHRVAAILTDRLCCSGARIGSSGRAKATQFRQILGNADKNATMEVA